MRKKKKRRKKQLPRSGCTRRRRRQWHDRCAGSAGCDAPRDVFPLVDDWPDMLCNTAGMDLQVGVFVVVVAVAYAWLVLLISLLALCFLLSSSGPDTCAVGWFCWGRCTSRCILFSCLQAQDARHHGRYGREGQSLS